MLDCADKEYRGTVGFGLMKSSVLFSAAGPNLSESLILHCEYWEVAKHKPIKMRQHKERKTKKEVTQEFNSPDVVLRFTVKCNKCRFWGSYWKLKLLQLVHLAGNTEQ